MHACQHNLPVHRDAKDSLLGGENLGHYIYVSVGSVLGDNDGLVDLCNNSRGLPHVKTGLKSACKDAHAHTVPVKSPISNLKARNLFDPADYSA